MEISENFIIFFDGIYLSDIKNIEEKYNDDIMDSLNEDYPIEKDKKTIIYDKIPKVFINIKEWVETTTCIKIHCWYCNLLFKNTPWFIPKEMYNTNKGKCIDVYGIFCTVGCAYGYLNSYSIFKDDKTYWDKVQLLKILYKKFYNKDILDLNSSPDKIKLKQYGGNLTLKEYKTELHRINEINLNSS